VITDLLKSFSGAVATYLIQILLGIIVLLAIFAGIQTARLRWSDKDLQIVQAKNENLSTEIAAQNKAIQRWQEEGEMARLQAEVAQQAAAKVRAKSNRRIAKLQAEQVPTDCTEAAQWAAGKAAELTRTWQAIPAP
jgi:hypothetical protein